MKLCTYQLLNDEGQKRAGFYKNEKVYDISSCLEAFGKEVGKVPKANYTDMLSILGAGEAAMDGIRKLDDIIDNPDVASPAERYSSKLDDVKLLAPVTRPNSIRDFLAFEQHLINCMQTVAGKMFPPAGWINGAMMKLGRPLLRPSRQWYKSPVYYKGNPDTVIGPFEDVIWPSFTEKLDYELEFGIYIGKKGKDIKADEAKNYIAGYTIFNDMSARDIQLQEMRANLGPAKGKDFDTGNVMGPFLVTPDEVGDPYALDMEAFVNGERWSSGNSSTMYYTYEQIIEHVSMSETLYPGDFLGSGTVGTGCGLELDRWLKPGDEITLKVEKLGELTNKIVRK
jgi:2-keto-4-pentenoate hydratase/2-oxohepta-3-ene-1,7-dioic acid hydratase in catechol pathway